MQTTDRSQTVLDEKIENLIAIGAAVAANCIPCFEYLYEKAILAGCTTPEIQRVSAIAGRVKNGAHIALKNSINEITSTEEPQTQPCGGTQEKPCCC